MNQRFRGKSIIITGAGAGLGKATALRLAEEGADLSLVVEKEWPDHLKPAAQNEIDMLELTAVEGTEGSRLSCQITVTEETGWPDCSPTGRTLITAQSSHYGVSILTGILRHPARTLAQVGSGNPAQCGRVLCSRRYR